MSDGGGEREAPRDWTRKGVEEWRALCFSYSLLEKPLCITRSCLANVDFPESPMPRSRSCRKVERNAKKKGKSELEEKRGEENGKDLDLSFLVSSLLFELELDLS